MKQPSKMDKIEERLLKRKKAIENENYFYPQQKAMALEFENKKLDQHRETKKDVYEDVKKILPEIIENVISLFGFDDQVENAKKFVLKEINKKLGEEKP